MDGRDGGCGGASLVVKVRLSSEYEWEETSRVVDQCEVNCTSVVKVR